MTISSTEVEYVAATSIACQALWMCQVFLDLHHHQEELTPILCDNKLTIALSKNYIFHKRRKHTDTRYHFIKELVNNGEIYVEFYKSED